MSDSGKLDENWKRIDEKDHRYTSLKRIMDQNGIISGNKICDLGCGLGRYLRNLKRDYSGNSYFGADPICVPNAELKEEGINIYCGLLTSTPFENDEFDFVYACESMEHAIDIKSAIKEMVRITKPGGWIAVIDKDEESLGVLAIGEWEQWFGKEELLHLIQEYCTEASVESKISPNGMEDQKIFCLWKGRIR